METQSINTISELYGHYSGNKVSIFSKNNVTKLDRLRTVILNTERFNELSTTLKEFELSFYFKADADKFKILLNSNSIGHVKNNNSFDLCPTGDEINIILNFISTIPNNQYSFKDSI